MKERILSEAERLFWRYGVRSVTMDDIARQLGISKKTIYQHFSDKEDILCKVIEQKISEDVTELRCYAAEGSNPIEELLMVLELLDKKQWQINPSLVIDVKRHYPQAFTLFRCHMDQHLMKSILENIQKGVEEGLYRDDINPAILARVRVEQIELAFNNELFPTDQFSMLDVQRELIHHFVRGMLSEKGFNIYNQLISTQERIQPDSL